MALLKPKLAYKVISIEIRYHYGKKRTSKDNIKTSYLYLLLNYETERLGNICTYFR